MKTVMPAGLLLLGVPATSALAHEDGTYEGLFRQRLGDQLEHLQFHRELNYRHGEAHEQGFNSPSEHRARHRAYGETHQDFHQDHPGTGVGSWGWWRNR